MIIKKGLKNLLNNMKQSNYLVFCIVYGELLDYPYSVHISIVFDTITLVAQLQKTPPPSPSAQLQQTGSNQEAP